MLIIMNSEREIVAAQVQQTDADDGEYAAFIFPANDAHSLYRVQDVPEDICALTDPAAFEMALGEHVKSGRAKITQTSMNEVREALRSQRASSE
jgi:1,4-alpha-glucan branching enzyme